MTPKAGFSYINVLRRERKFPKLATVINGLDMSKRKNSYGYGYGKKYGYGKGYGYGYGYGSGYGYGGGYGYGNTPQNKEPEKGNKIDNE